ncbi:MAG: hypothetical protein RBU21_24945 [FCB group bacterium]|nr:hypothetical protein [FCB group bacterium]
MFDWVIVAMALVAVAGAVTSVVLRKLRNRPKKMRAVESIQMTCPSCRRELVFSSRDLQVLSPVEMGLVVRTKPSVVRRPLADYTCPYCEAAHCFTIDGKPEWIGVDLYQPRDSSNDCFECRQPLKRLPQGSGGLTERVDDVDSLEPEMGLKCPRCHSICCVRCCRRVSRGHTTDGSLLCPRCHRGPVNLLYFP